MAGPEIDFSERMAARWAPLYRTAYLLTGARHEAEDLPSRPQAKSAAV
jgi:hypothetical protein